MRVLVFQTKSPKEISQRKCVLRRVRHTKNHKISFKTSETLPQALDTPPSSYPTLPSSPHQAAQQAPNTPD